MKHGKILVGMSGGIDSTYSVTLLRRMGYEVVGATLVFSEHTDTQSTRQAAKELSVPLYEYDVSALFAEKVQKNFAFCYENGMTPNPCVVCNRYVKMQALYELSLSLGCDGFATGHYAKPILLPNGRYAVAMGKDKKKDQSYMLWGMTQEQLSRFVAPLADFEKVEIKKSAEQEGLSSARAAESQDICFIPDGNYVAFLKDFGVKKGFEEGHFVDTKGKSLGMHKGICHYTVGQRKGLGIALGYPAFVTDIDPVSHKITLAPLEETYQKRIRVGSLVFQGLPDTDHGEFDLTVKIRYAAPPVPCHVAVNGDIAYVEFAEGIRTPAPGQSAVFYQDGVLMLGGVILRDDTK